MRGAKYFLLDVWLMVLGFTSAILALRTLPPHTTHLVITDVVDGRTIGARQMPKAGAVHHITVIANYRVSLIGCSLLHFINIHSTTLRP